MSCQHRGQICRVEGQARGVEIARQLCQKFLPAPRLGKLAVMFGNPRDPRVDRADQRDELAL